MTASVLAVGGLAAALVATALFVILARNVVHAVVAMIAHFLLTAVLYLALHAPLIAMAQVAVYAGAIMVLFLFVVMLMGGGTATTGEPRPAQRWLGLPLAAVLAALLIAVVWRGAPALGVVPRTGALPADFGSPASIGQALFRQELVSFEIVGILLLVAVVGAVVIALERRDDGESVPGDDQ